MFLHRERKGNAERSRAAESERVQVRAIEEETRGVQLAIKTYIETESAWNRI